MNSRRSKQGYYRMGPVRIPPLPAIVGLTDREDGTIWYLTHDTDFTRIALNSDLSEVNIAPSDRYQDFIIYGAYEGPYLDKNIQLMVRDGRIGYDYRATQPGVSFYGYPPPWTRRRVEQRHFKIFKGDSFNSEGDVLSFTPDD